MSVDFGTSRNRVGDHESETSMRTGVAIVPEDVSAAVGANADRLPGADRRGVFDAFNHDEPDWRRQRDPESGSRTELLPRIHVRVFEIVPDLCPA